MGYCHLSFRQSVEIIGVHIDDFDAAVKELAAFGQPIASCGPRIRVPTACGGNEYNPNGVMDAQKKALEVDKELFGMNCPHKFKISFSACPIDCARTRGMDLGFQGVVDPGYEDDPCTGCTLCEKACLEGAIVSDDDGKPVFDREKCVFCGDCIKACPTDAWTPKRKGWAVRAGGKHGRHPRKADNIMLFCRMKRCWSTSVRPSSGITQMVIEERGSGQLLTVLEWRNTRKRLRAFLVTVKWKRRNLYYSCIVGIMRSYIRPLCLP